MTTPVWSAPTTVRVARLRARRQVTTAAVGVLSVALAATAALAWGDDARLAGDARPDRARSVPVPVAPNGTGNVAELQPAVARAMRLAAAAAAADGVDLQVTSGWRSADRQAVLHAEAVRKYGSRQAARQWVLPPQESQHVTGRAVDVGPPAGVTWLSRHGVRFGLCQRYANEPWHFERLAGAKGSSCPAMAPHP